MSEASLAQLFSNNKKLRSLTICGYFFPGKCFTELNLETMEVLNLIKCHMKPTSFNSMISTAQKLHTLTFYSCEIDDIADIDLTFKISTQTPLMLMRLNVSGLHCALSNVKNICKMTNLTILIISESTLKDHGLKLIARNCVKLRTLHIDMNDYLTDKSLSSISALPKLENLHIGYNDNFTDAGLKMLNMDLKILNVASSQFSAKALLSAIERMQFLEQLDVGGCEHLGNSFVHSVLKIVKQRKNKIPLELGVFDSAIDISEIKESCSLVRLTDRFEVDYRRYY